MQRTERELGTDLGEYVAHIFKGETKLPGSAPLIVEPVDGEPEPSRGELAKILTEVAVQGMSLTFGHPNTWDFSQFSQPLKDMVCSRMMATGFTVEILDDQVAAVNRIKSGTLCATPTIIKDKHGKRLYVLYSALYAR